MVTATEPQGTSGTMTTTYQYDGDGRRVDGDGGIGCDGAGDDIEAVELFDNEDERRKQLEGLKQAVSAKAGAYLYSNAEKDKDGNETGQFFVGVLGGGPGA